MGTLDTPMLTLPTPTMARDLLSPRLSLRLRLTTVTTVFPTATATLDTPMLTLPSPTMARDPLTPRPTLLTRSLLAFPSPMPTPPVTPTTSDTSPTPPTQPLPTLPTLPTLATLLTTAVNFRLTK